MNKAIFGLIIVLAVAFFGKVALRFFVKQKKLTKSKLISALIRIWKFLPIFIFIALADYLMLVCFGPIKRFLFDVLDADIILSARSILTLLFGSPSVAFALETVSASLLLNLGVISFISAVVGLNFVKAVQCFNAFNKRIDLIQNKRFFHFEINKNNIIFLFSRLND